MGDESTVRLTLRGKGRVTCHIDLSDEEARRIGGALSRGEDVTINGFGAWTADGVPDCLPGDVL